MLLFKRVALLSTKIKLLGACFVLTLVTLCSGFVWLQRQQLLLSRPLTDVTDSSVSGAVDTPSLSATLDTQSPFPLELLPKKISKNDRVSPVTLKLICDWHFGEESIPNEDAVSIKTLQPDQVQVIKNNSVLFVASPYLKTFFETIWPLLNVSFVLVSGDTDDSIPFKSLGSELTTRVLQDPNLLHWYAMNCDMPLDVQAKTPQFSCLMNGISQWEGQRQGMQQAFDFGLGLVDGITQNLTLQKSPQKWLLASFSIPSNPKERQQAYNLGCNPDSSLSNVTTCFFDRHMDRLELYTAMAEHRFVLSPLGNGLDCYRTYETLYLGSFPIVKTSSLNSLFRNLPVLIVKDWSDVTLELLEKTYQDFRRPQRQHEFKFEKLYVQYWNHTFRSHFPRI